MCTKCGDSGFSYSGKPCQFCSAGKKAKNLADQKQKRQNSKESWQVEENVGRNFDYGCNTSNDRNKYRSS